MTSEADYLRALAREEAAYAYFDRIRWAYNQDVGITDDEVAEAQKACEEAYAATVAANPDG